MKQALALTVALLLVLETGRLTLGDGAVMFVAYGGMAIMALMIAATFLWLWAERTTPLALGMALSWLGAGLLAGWWWADARWHLASDVPTPHGIYAVLAIYLVGVVLHFAVIQRSFGKHGLGFLWPVAVAFGVAVLGYLWI